jgi:putative transposase
MRFTTRKIPWDGRQNSANGFKDIRKRVREIFSEVVAEHEFEIQETRVASDHVHVLWGFPPRYSITHVVGMLKSIAASEIFDEFPEVKNELRGENFAKMAIL